MTLQIQNKEHKKNVDLFNQRVSDIVPVWFVLKMCKLAGIELHYSLIDDEAKDLFCDYYGYLPLKFSIGGRK